MMLVRTLALGSTHSNDGRPWALVYMLGGKGWSYVGKTNLGRKQGVGPKGMEQRVYEHWALAIHGATSELGARHQYILRAGAPKCLYFALVVRDESTSLAIESALIARLRPVGKVGSANFSGSA